MGQFEELQPFARQMEHLKLAKTTDCRSTDVFLTIFVSQLTGVPPTAFHDNLSKKKKPLPFFQYISWFCAGRQIWFVVC